MKLGRWIPVFCLALGGAATAADREDLASLLAEAERANPELLASRARAEAASGVPDQLRALPDPRLAVSYTNDGLGGFTLGSSEFSNVSVIWDQDVPYRKVREASAGVAKAEAEVLRASASTRQARVRARVITAYVELWRTDASRDILEEGRALLSASVGTARARYEAGDGSQESLLRAQIAVHRVDVELVELTRARRTAEIALGEALGRLEDTSFGPAGELPGGALAGDAAHEEDDAAEDAPELVEARAGQARAQAAIEDARGQSRPELGWMAGYQFRGGLDPMVMGGVTVRLPVWKGHKQLARVSQAEREAEAARRDRDAAEISTRARVRGLIAEVTAAERELVFYTDALIPQDAAAADAARAALSAGRGELGSVLDGTGRWLSDRRAAADLQARRVQALAALEGASGTILLAPRSSGGAR